MGPEKGKRVKIPRGAAAVRGSRCRYATGKRSCLSWEGCKGVEPKPEDLPVGMFHSLYAHLEGNSF